MCYNSNVAKFQIYQISFIFKNQISMKKTGIRINVLLTVVVAESQIGVNQSYQESYSDKNSIEYRNFTEAFCKEVRCLKVLTHERFVLIFVGQ